jgi:hypothetical protein
VDDVDHDVDGDDPGPPAGRVAGLGLAESGGDDLGRVEFHRPGQPFRLRPGPWAKRAVTVAPAGLGDHVVRAARGWVGVVDAGQGGHPLAVGFLPGRQLVLILPWRAAAFAVAGRSAPGRITIPLASAEITSSVGAVHGAGTRAA